MEEDKGGEDSSDKAALRRYRIPESGAIWIITGS